MARLLLVLSLLPVAALGAARQASPPLDLPPGATAKLAQSLDASQTHISHVWRDTPPVNQDGTVNGYVEITHGDRRKWEFSMQTHERVIDRMIQPTVGGYPVNYGFVPQTISYDGDPFDILVLGPPIAGGSLVRGVVVGLMLMEDEKGLDSKVVLSRAGPDGQPLQALTAAARQEIGDYFKRYKEHEPGAFSRVPGWGSAAEGLAHVTTTHAFFRGCRQRAGAPCRVER
jgi:inorganic pyrophosphatase